MKGKYNYGNCDMCGAQMEEKLIKQDFWIRDELIVIENVPAGACPQCGEKIVKSDVGHLLSDLIKNPEIIANAPKISVPSIKFNSEKVSV